MTAKNKHFVKTLLSGTICFVFLTVSVPDLYGQSEADGKASLFSRAALLIYDESIREELEVTQDQTPGLDQLCEKLDQLLFAMRDVPPDTTDSQAIALAGQITEKLKELDHLLNSRQQKRLRQLSLQYEGFGSLFHRQVQLQLGLTANQVEQIRQCHLKSIKRQQEVAQRQSAKQNGSSAQQKIQKIVQQEAQQIRRVMGKDQHQQWQSLLGDAFDFSQMRPMSFRVPELKNVTAWINTRPISMKDLRGRVVVVHFWTFGCNNCIHNYPVYKEWAQKYDPQQVQVLGIHTPEAEYEKDLKALRKGIEQEGLSFAVAVDNDKTNWNAWSNRIWPSVYLVDKTGRVRYWWYGELKWKGSAGDQWIGQRIEELRAE